MKFESAEAKRNYMLEEPVEKLVCRLAVPTILSMLITSFYNMADTFFVGRINTQSTAAVGVVFSLMSIIQAVGFLFGHGSGNYISRKLGAGEIEEAEKMSAVGFFTSFLAGIMIMAGCMFFIMPLSYLLGSTETIQPYTVAYLRFILIGAPAMTASLVLNNQMRFQGSAFYAMIGIVSGAVINIVLDPVLIFGLGPFPRMGIEGAALATGIGQTISLVIYLVIYLIKPLPVRLRFRRLNFQRNMVLKLYAIGIPATLNMALPSLLISALNVILSAYSQAYVTVLGIYYKLQTFLYLPANGIVQGMRPLVGYNYGASEHRRVHKIYRVALLLAVGIMVLGTVLCQAIPSELISLFTSGSETISAGTSALRIISIGFLASTVSVISSGALEGLGMGLPSLMISLLRYVLITIPAAFLLSRFLGASGVWHGFWISELLTAAIAYVIYHRAVRRQA